MLYYNITIVNGSSLPCVSRLATVGWPCDCVTECESSSVGCEPGEGDTAACRSFSSGGCAGGKGYAHLRRRRWTPVCPLRRCLCLAYYTILCYYTAMIGGGVAVYFPHTSTVPQQCGLQTSQASCISRVTVHWPLSSRS